MARNATQATAFARRCDGEALEAPPLRILVADDDAWMRRLLQRSLGAQGHVVEVVADGRSLVRAFLDSPRPDLVVSDQQMPGLTGLAALQQLREQGVGTPFVLMSGDADAGLCDHAGRLGAQVIPKPFDPRDLDFIIAGL